jgi:hypothetical protein
MALATAMTRLAVSATRTVTRVLRSAWWLSVASDGVCAAAWCRVLKGAFDVAFECVPLTFADCPG